VTSEHPTLTPPGDTPRRLLFVVNESFFFLSHRLALARAAAQAGYEVHVAAPADHVWAPKNFSTDEIGSHGFTFHSIALSRRGKNPLQDLKTLLALVRLYRRLKPSLVHHLTIKPVIYGGIAARLAGISAVVNAVTGLGQIFVAKGVAASLLRHLISTLYKFSLNHANSRVIVQNQGDGTTLSNLIDPGRIELIRGSGAPMDNFSPRPFEPGTPIVILPARLIWEKGVGDFAKAAQILKNQGLVARFALVGDTHPSNPRAVPATQIQKWVNEGILEWWGRQDDMAEVFARAHAVCLPSTYGEGVPRALIEAAACGRPIIATDTAGCREIARHDENALLVPPGNIAELAAALRRITQDNDLRERLGRRGREIASAEFDERMVVERTLDIYRMLENNLN